MWMWKKRKNKEKEEKRRRATARRMEELRFDSPATHWQQLSTTSRFRLQGEIQRANGAAPCRPLDSIHPRFLRGIENRGGNSRGTTRGNERHALVGRNRRGRRWYSLWNLVLRMDKIWCSLWRLSFVAFSCLSRARACSLISMSAEQHTSPPLFTPPHTFSSLAASEKTKFALIPMKFRNRWSTR